MICSTKINACRFFGAGFVIILMVVVFISVVSAPYTSDHKTTF